MNCKRCGSEKVIKAGKPKATTPRQRYFCNNCHHFFSSIGDNKQ